MATATATATAHSPTHAHAHAPSNAHAESLGWRPSIEASLAKLQSLAIATSATGGYHPPDAIMSEIDTAAAAEDMDNDDAPHERPFEAYAPVYSPLPTFQLVSSNRPPSLVMATRRIPASLAACVRESMSMVLDSPNESATSSSATSSGCSSSCAAGWSVTPIDRYGSESPNILPFEPVIPMLLDDWEPQHRQQQQIDTDRSNNEHDTSPQPIGEVGSFSSIASTRSHLMHLASSSFGFLSSPSSLPSSAASSCPVSPDLRSVSPLVSLDSDCSPTLHVRVAGGATAAHQSSMELSARRRAREALKGRDSVTRMKMKGLSSRAQAQHHVSPNTFIRDASASSSSSSPAFHLGDPALDHRAMDDDDSDYETPSPISTPFASARGRLKKPLMSSQGYIGIQATGVSCGSYSPLLAGECDSTALARVDPDVLLAYLTPLSPTELAHTIEPIRALLPRQTTAQLSELGRQEDHLGDEDGGRSLESILDDIPNMSNLHLSLLLDRCIARTQWRRSIPADLLQHAYSFLDLSSLLVHGSRISKHWRACVRDLLSHDPHWQSELSTRQAEMKRRHKLKVYRRLTLEDSRMIKLITPTNQEGDETNDMTDEATQSIVMQQ